MKKLLCLLLSIVMLCAFVACSEEAAEQIQTTAPGANQEETNPTEPPEPTTYELVYTKTENGVSVAYALCANGKVERLGENLEDVAIASDCNHVVYGKESNDSITVYTKQPNENATVLVEQAYSYAYLSQKDMILVCKDDVAYTADDISFSLKTLDGMSESAQFVDAFLSDNGSYLYLVNPSFRILAVDLANGSTDILGYAGQMQELIVTKDAALYIPSNNPGKAFWITGNAMQTLALLRFTPGTNVITLAEDEKSYAVSYEFGLVEMDALSVVAGSANGKYIVTKTEDTFTRYTVTAEGLSDAVTLEGKYLAACVTPDGIVALAGMGGAGLSLWDGETVQQATAGNIKFASVTCIDGKVYYLADLSADATTGNLYVAGTETPIVEDVSEIVTVR